MNFECTDSEKKAIFNALKTEYLYILIPFIFLVSIKGYMGNWSGIVMSADWSLASCLVFGQITSKVSRAVVACKEKTNEQYFGLYSAKRFLFIVLSIALYFGMLAKPSGVLGCIQILWFIFAGILHFSDGFATALLQKSSAGK